MAHAFYLIGDQESAIASAHAFVKKTLGLRLEPNCDVIELRHTNFSVDDARMLRKIESQAPIEGDQKVIIVAAARLFPDAQNALLKIFEEPSPSTTLILIVPSEGVLLPTLRSRMVRIDEGTQPYERGREFLALSSDERKKYLEKIVERTKADKDSEKQEGRREMLELAQDLLGLLHHEKDKELLRDLATFVEILHKASAPIKLIAEHLLLVLPQPTRLRV